MPFGFDADSPRKHFLPNMASRANKATYAPCDYEKELSLEDEFCTGHVGDIGISRTDSLTIVASVAAAVMIFSSFVHADTIKDGISESTSVLYDVATYPDQLVHDLIVGLNGIRK